MTYENYWVSVWSEARSKWVLKFKSASFDKALNFFDDQANRGKGVELYADAELMDRANLEHYMR